MKIPIVPIFPSSRQTFENTRTIRIQMRINQWSLYFQAEGTQWHMGCETAGSKTGTTCSRAPTENGPRKLVRLSRFCWSPRAHFVSAPITALAATPKHSSGAVATTTTPHAIHSVQDTAFRLPCTLSAAHKNMAAKNVEGGINAHVHKKNQTQYRELAVMSSW